MARQESDREDLLREAIALVRRGEWSWQVAAEPVVAGFRETGWFSIYFGQDLMFGFNERGQLRRSYRSGRLYRSHGTFLAELQRQRTQTETILARRDLAANELAEFRQFTHARLQAWLAAESAGEVTLLRQFPVEDSTLATDIRAACEAVLAAPEFLAPAISVRK